MMNGVCACAYNELNGIGGFAFVSKDQVDRGGQKGRLLHGSFCNCHASERARVRNALLKRAHPLQLVSLH